MNKKQNLNWQLNLIKKEFILQLNEGIQFYILSAFCVF